MDTRPAGGSDLLLLLTCDAQEKPNSNCTSNLVVLLILARQCWRRPRWLEDTTCLMLLHHTNHPAQTGMLLRLLPTRQTQLVMEAGSHRLMSFLTCHLLILSTWLTLHPHTLESMATMDTGIEYWYSHWVELIRIGSSLGRRFTKQYFWFFC